MSSTRLNTNLHGSLLLYNMHIYIYIYVTTAERYVYVELCLHVWPSQGKVANPARGQQLNKENELFAVLVRA